MEKLQQDESGILDGNDKRKNDRKLRDFTIKQIHENFYHCCIANATDFQNKVPLRHFNSLIRLCGSTMSKQETFNLLKKAQFDS